MIQQLYISHIAGVPLIGARSTEANQETLGLIGSCHLTHSVSSRGQADKVIIGSTVVAYHLAIDDARGLLVYIKCIKKTKINKNIV